MKAQWTFIFILIFALVTAIFAVINVEPVQVHLLFTETTIPLILVILSSTLLGGLIVGLIGISKQFKLKRTIKQLEKQLNELKTGQAQPPAAATADVPATLPVESEEKDNNPIG
ncbi:lipopolysaccharide assembly LapA domain-containing protein [Paenibacillus sp. TAB 01]|uniref:LapA family protein n=1 Tax=Paenibacillus sp. TAB 01 TaxID=3368988 RepID=UPI0037508735